MNGADAIAAERARHSQLGYDRDHDMRHTHEELLSAALCYTYAARWAQFNNLSQPMPVWARDNIAAWPWEEQYWKPSDNPQRNLEKAGSFLAAEWDRLEQLRKDMA